MTLAGEAGVQAAFARKRELQEVEEALGKLRRSVAEMWQAEEQIEARQNEAVGSVEKLEAEAGAF